MIFDLGDPINPACYFYSHRLPMGGYGENEGTRTLDQYLKRVLLYQLSYILIYSSVRIVKRLSALLKTIIITKAKKKCTNFYKFIFPFSYIELSF